MLSAIKKKKERIGIFGGTFNPIHRGHLAAAAIVQRKFFLDKIIFIPSYFPPHKESVDVASPRDRLRMVELAVSAHPMFMASPIEIEAREKSYAIITLNKVIKLYPQAWIFFILGIDAFLEVEAWREWKNVLKKCLFIVISRPGYRLSKAKEILGHVYRKTIFDLSKTLKVREELFLSNRIFLLPIGALDISSTDIRRRIKESKPWGELIPGPVKSYIKEHKLYQENRKKDRSSPERRRLEEG